MKLLTVCLLTALLLGVSTVVVSGDEGYPDVAYAPITAISANTLDMLESMGLMVVFDTPFVPFGTADGVVMGGTAIIAKAAPDASIEISYVSDIDFLVDVMKTLSDLGIVAVAFDYYTTEALNTLNEDWEMIISRGLIDPNCPYRIERDRMIAENALISPASQGEEFVETVITPHSTSRLVQIPRTQTDLPWHCTNFTIIQGDVIAYRVWFGHNVHLRYALGLVSRLRVIQNGAIVHMREYRHDNPIVRVDGMRFFYVGFPANFALNPLVVSRSGFYFYGRYYVSWGHIIQ
jgi:hypothetical protein